MECYIHQQFKKAEEMNFNKHIETILRWIASCENEEQLNMCREAIEHFIMIRFKHYVDRKVLQDAYSKLIIAANDKHFEVHGVGLEVL